MIGIQLNNEFFIRFARQDVDRVNDISYIELKLDLIEGTTFTQELSKKIRHFAIGSSKQESQERWNYFKDLTRTAFLTQLHQDLTAMYNKYVELREWELQSSEDKGFYQYVNEDGITIQMLNENPRKAEYLELQQDSQLGVFIDEIVQHIYVQLKDDIDSFNLVVDQE